VIEKCNECGIETHHLFVDFRGAYNSLDTSNLYNAMEELHFPPKGNHIALVKATMRNALCQIRIQNLLSDSTHVKKLCQARRCPGLPAA
jgi:hypothetical protein